MNYQPEQLKAMRDAGNTMLYADELAEDAIALHEQAKEYKELAKAVAHIGIDWGYGEYELEPKFVEMARRLYEADEGVQSPTLTPPQENE